MAMRSRIEGDQGNYVEGIQLTQACLDRDPENVRLLHNMGYFHFRLKEYEAVIPVVEKARKLDPDDPAAYSLLGMAFYYLGRKEEGLKYLNRSTGLWKANPVAYLFMGMIAVAEGNISEAKGYLNLALQYQSVVYCEREIQDLTALLTPVS
jgi:tetratricopeptide (TPR) repeat protein